MKKYIDLFLRTIDPENNQLFLFKDLVATFNFVVILGAPGSGKTTLLKNYNKCNPTISKYLTVQQFLSLNLEINENTLLLDGFDEYRALAPDKTFICDKIGHEISTRYPNRNIVITCREMDWYGDDDTLGLSEYVSWDIKVFRICQLNKEQKEDFARELVSKTNNPSEFIRKFDSFGFLENPQTFTMLSELYNKKELEIKSKKELFQRYIFEFCKERNQSYKNNRINVISEDVYIKCAGYLSYYFFFSGVESFDNDILEKIADNPKFSLENLQITLNSKLFVQGTFIHRTIAEFVLASFFMSLMNDCSLMIFEDHIISMFAPNNNVPIDLRGVFSWLCSLTGNERFIRIDPYYQLIHGDNTTFGVELKKKVILAIKKYARTHPYFFSKEYTFSLEGFYTQELDGFLEEEISQSLPLQNHYLLFVVSIVSNANKLSTNMMNFLRNLILTQYEGIEPYIAVPIIGLLKHEVDTLIKILDLTKSKEMKDAFDRIKDSILSILVPNKIDIGELPKYLFSYQTYVGGHCWYLLNLNYKNKEELIEKLFQYRNKEESNNLPQNVQGFVDDFYAETLSKYKKGLSAEKIYDKLQIAREQFLKEHETISFQSFRTEINEELNDKIRIDELTNMLFKMYVENISNLKTKNIYASFLNFYNYRKPTNAFSIILDTMAPSRSNEENKILFKNALDLKTTEEIKIDPDLVRIAQMYSFQDIMNERLNHKPFKWELNAEKEKEQKEEQQREILDKNEKNFALPDQEILKDFSRLYYIAQILYFFNPKDFRYFKDNTFERLKTVLAQLPFVEIIDAKNLTIEHLAKTLPGYRKIDIVYSVATFLNQDFDIEALFVKDKSYVRYLFINAFLRQNDYLNFKKGNFLTKFEREKESFAASTLNEFINSIANLCISEHKKLMDDYIAKENSLHCLKKLANLDFSNKKGLLDAFLENFLTVYHFTLDSELLGKLSALKINIDNQSTIKTIQAIQGDDSASFSKTMLISLYQLIKHQFQNFESEYKVRISDFMMDQFNTEQSIVYRSGFQSPIDDCAEFVREELLQRLDLIEIKNLMERRKTKQDIWINYMYQALAEKTQKECDSNQVQYGLDQLKKLLKSNQILDNKMFFFEVKRRIDLLKNEIEANRNSEKNPFWNDNKKNGITHKNEPDCRDYIRNLLANKYSNDLELTREKCEGKNLVDICIAYTKNPIFQVQVECKGDWNQDLEKSIGEQLVEKYMGHGSENCGKPNYGIYLVFYTGAKGKQIDQLQQDLEECIPEEHLINIKVICIDITLT